MPSLRCPSGEVEQGSGYSFLGFGKEVRVGDTHLGVLGMKNESVSHSVMPCSFVNPRTVACQALLSMEFSRQNYWRRASPFPGDLP